MFDARNHSNHSSLGRRGNRYHGPLQARLERRSHQICDRSYAGFKPHPGPGSQSSCQRYSIVTKFSRESLNEGDILWHDSPQPEKRNAVCPVSLTSRQPLARPPSSVEDGFGGFDVESPTSSALEWLDPAFAAASVYEPVVILHWGAFLNLDLLSPYSHD